MAEIIHWDARKFGFVLYFCDNEKAIFVYKVSSRRAKAVIETSPASEKYYFCTGNFANYQELVKPWILEKNVQPFH